MSPATLFRLGPLSDLEDGGGVLAVAAGVEVGVFRLGDRLVAYENRCAHQGGPVCTGEIVGRYEQVLNPDGTVRGERLADDEPHLVCPWHGFEYDLATGECAADRRFRLRRCEVTVRDGDVYISV
ncbi:MAG: Rieske 2Fe-2S domain-containing protein [Candidatus Dormibacteraeota bacterium]|nr:Rieske 2Fe-2S domain-containing protein [Candidatus Dormibacteraeota bacterium]